MGQTFSMLNIEDAPLMNRIKELFTLTLNSDTGKASFNFMITPGDAVIVRDRVQKICLTPAEIDEVINAAKKLEVMGFLPKEIGRWTPPEK